MRRVNDSNLYKLLEILQKRCEEYNGFFYEIPELWNCFGYNGEELKKGNGVIYVNPYEFYKSCIQDYLLKEINDEFDYSKSLSSNMNIDNKEGYLGGDWIKKSSIYSMQVRTSSSWDHDGCGELKEINNNGLKETGTFVKSLVLIPLLKKMGINTIYLLPIAQHSYKNKKGEKGSPYAVKNFFKIDEELKDPLTGDELTVEEEFAAFVEACHMVGIRVMIDIIPRTCARDNQLIMEHPEWFYWVRVKDLEYYKPPTVNDVGVNVKPTYDNLWKIYQSHSAWDVMLKFVHSPNILDNNLWTDLIAKCASDCTLNILDLIESEYGITTAPAFSDCINDPQPPWDDVTFLRMYLDHPVASSWHLNGKDLPPYIMHDVIKSNLFKGNIENRELWNVIADIIPFYQKNFGVDAARIDMGHAIPDELVGLIINRAREVDGDFAFVAEELFPEGAEQASRMGYNMIIGYGFYMEPRIAKKKAHQFFYDSRWLKLPVFATGETADTRRLVAREGGVNLVKLLTVLNQFMPNGVPFINSGLELFEAQPMNTGLDCEPYEQWHRLAHDDKYNGRLSFFDRYAFHWNNVGARIIPDILENVSEIRRKYIDILSDTSNFRPIWMGSFDSNVVAFGWVNINKIDGSKDMLIAVGNMDLYNHKHIYLHLYDIMKEKNINKHKANIIYSLHNDGGELPIDLYNINLHLNPGEVKIIEL